MRHPALDELRSLASALPGIDVECYRRYGQDPLEPVLGLGDANARWCFFGRDPGEQEVRQQRPFVGPAGAKIREAMREVGLDERDVFWINTVPYKPVGNKPWALSVRRRFRPPLLQLLATWKGTHVIAFGEAAFFWFGLESRAIRGAMEQFWAREDKYTAEFIVALDLGTHQRQFTLCPVPHPSGANARWAKAFPALLRRRLTPAAGPSAACRG